MHAIYVRLCVRLICFELCNLLSKHCVLIIVLYFLLIEKNDNNKPSMNRLQHQTVIHNFLKIGMHIIDIRKVLISHICINTEYFLYSKKEYKMKMISDIKWRSYLSRYDAVNSIESMLCHTFFVCGGIV